MNTPSIGKLLLPLLLALFIAGCAGSATRESTGEVFDNSWITSQIKSQLLADRNTSAMKISVETFKGVVQLSGFATTAETRRAIEIARAVKGVKEVKNNIQIRE